MNELDNYNYRGARAMVLLHEKHLKECLESWKAAKALNISLPATSDEDYASLESLLRHILGAARGYMVWICERLELGDPAIDPVPDSKNIETEADAYLSHLLERWQRPLATVEEERFYRPEYPSNWKVLYCIDAMLEHAVMHPIRHQFQLKELIAQQS